MQTTDRPWIRTFLLERLNSTIDLPVVPAQLLRHQPLHQSRPMAESGGDEAEPVRLACRAVQAGLGMGAVLALFGIGKAVETTPQSEGVCPALRSNQTLSAVFLKTNQAEGFLRPRPNICEVLSQFTTADQKALVLTTTRIGRLYGVCIGESSTTPCSRVIAEVEEGVQAGEALQFAYGLTLEQGGPQRQTVERLFIKPSALIR